jgi:cell fate regulator YaaT (PSP1 superfamily)
MPQSYLVQYGKCGFVGRFRPAGAEPHARGDRVVVRSRRGLELGTVLCEPAARFDAPDDGDLLRAATDADAAAESRTSELLAAAQARVEELGLPLALVDAEMLLDGSAVVQGLPWAECDASVLFEELTARFGGPVRLLDLSRGEVAKDELQHGCGKPGCGSESGGCSSCGTGGGCSTGSCSRGSVKSADDLTAYFRGLREQMERQTNGRTPLA